MLGIVYVHEFLESTVSRVSRAQEIDGGAQRQSAGQSGAGDRDTAVHSRGASTRGRAAERAQY